MTPTHLNSTTIEIIQRFSKPIPTGKYLVKYKRQDIIRGVCIVAELTISAGEFEGHSIYIVITNAKAKSISKEYNSNWLPRIAFEGNKLAADLEHAISQAIDGNILIRFKDGIVSSVYDPQDTYEQIYKVLSSKWIIANSEQDWKTTFNSCKLFRAHTGCLPRLHGELPREHKLRIWLNKAKDTKAATFRPEVLAWYQEFERLLSAEYNSQKHGPYSSIRNWLTNHGIE